MLARSSPKFFAFRPSWRPNAMFTGKRRLSSREDARSETDSPGAHIYDCPRLSGATTRYAEAHPSRAGSTGSLRCNFRLSVQQ